MTICRKTTGFTLIELAAAFAVFALILLAVGTILQQSSNSWREGLDSVGTSDQGRAFTDDIFRDVTSAVCTSNFPFVVANSGSGDTAADAVYMIAGHPRYNDGTSDLAQVSYYLRADPDHSGRKVLLRRSQNTMDGLNRSDAYKVGGSRDTESKIKAALTGFSIDEYTSVVARNVRSFSFVCYDASGARYTSSIDPDRSDLTFVPSLLPARIEAMVKILPEDVWRQIEGGGATAATITAGTEIFSLTLSPTQSAH